MNISSRTECGIRALIEINNRTGNEPVKRATIAERQDIPLPFLSQILKSLVNGKIILSTRGPGGGYILAKPAAETSLLEVINLLQGPVMPRQCVNEKQTNKCEQAQNCGLINVWQQLRDAGEAVLRNTSIADVSSVNNKAKV